MPLGRKLRWRPFQPAQVHQKLPLLVPLYLLAPVMLWVFVATQNLTWRETGLGIGESWGDRSRWAGRSRCWDYLPSLACVGWGAG
jgi:hypothetical protein